MRKLCSALTFEADTEHDRALDEPSEVDPGSVP